MILFIIKQWAESFGWHVPTAFSYTSTRAILAAVTSLLFVLALGSRYIRQLYEWKIGQPIRDEVGFLLGELHKSKKNTPTMGGGLILLSILCSLFIWMDFTHPFTWILLLTTIILGALGGYDDYLKLRYRNAHGLSARKKLVVQLVWAVCVISYLQWPVVTQYIDVLCGFKPLLMKEAWTGSLETLSVQEFSSQLFVPFFKEPIFVFSGIGLVFLWLFFAFVIVGSSNSVNLTDGLDGLAAGLLIFVASTLGIVAFLANHLEIAEYLNIAYIEGSGEIAIFLAGLVGACLGFLWFNSHPAQIFMGDVGSLALGGLIGVTAILLNREFFLGLVGAIFVAEALSVIIQVIGYKFFNKKRIFRCAPLHHHFEYLGWSESKVVIRFWIIGFLLALIGLLSLKFQ